MIEGYDRVMRKIEKLVRARRALDDALLKVAAAIAAEAKKRAPVDTGRLRNSIFFKRLGSGKAIVGTNVQYAPFVELGHKAEIVPKKAKALRFYLRGVGWVFAKRVVQGISGKSARWIKEDDKIKFPFLVPALKESMEKIKQIIRQVVRLD